MNQYTYAIGVMALGGLLVSMAHSQTLPDAPSKVADRNFWALAGVNAGAVAADAITTVKLVGRPTAAPCPLEVWSAPLYGRQPNQEPARTIAVMAGKAAAVTAISYALKRYNVHVWKVKLWPAPLVWNAYGHTEGAIHNLRICQ